MIKEETNCQNQHKKFKWRSSVIRRQNKNTGIIHKHVFADNREDIDEIAPTDDNDLQVLKSEVDQLEILKVGELQDQTKFQPMYENHG